MNLDKLSEELNNIHESFSWINAGGCGEFAKLLGNKFKENNIKFKYVLFSDNSNRTILESIRFFNNSKTEVNEMEFRRNGYSIAHIMIYHKGYFIDSTGVHKNLNDTNWNISNGYKLSAILPQETLEIWCEQKTWNDMFNRDQLPKIQEKIERLELIN